LPSVILLADDDQTLRDLFAILLRRAGFDVRLAANGQDALALFRRAPDSIRLVITDVDMPMTSGIEVAAFVDQSGTGCPVLLISGKPFPQEVRERRWSTLAKPFTPRAFIQTVQDILASPPPATRFARPKVILAEDDAEIRRRLCAPLCRDYEVIA